MSVIKSDLNTIGERLYFLRRNARLSMQELASKLRIPLYDEENKEIIAYKAVAQSTINNIEKDINRPSSDIIIAICKYFGVSSDWLLTGKEYEPSENQGLNSSETMVEKKADHEQDKTNPAPDPQYLKHLIREELVNFMRSEEFSQLSLNLLVKKLETKQKET
ncbi:transcriptional regulator with XRE-family HTH domain [Paenibacillus sp. 1182]|uniref:helix-turn-helix domain-containing protein n=1 Tax=Paenibacillus sp. 1182 TaxID=2806565 RepID=UPI001AE665C9|nr:helix-turn-helix transcriptional regulator [Paenibacillus sp. 1182]MBP1308929.1 transcriptional regulator with XRE-family HTH domain [Paenibacillus sp. 1182]